MVQWDVFDLGISVATTILTALLAHVHGRLNRIEDLTRKLERDLRESIERVARDAGESRDDLRKEINVTLTQIYTRLDQTPTKQDLQDWVMIITKRQL